MSLFKVHFEVISTLLFSQLFIIMFFMFFITSVLSSEYLINMLLRAHLLLFLGADHINSSINSNLTIVPDAADEFLFNGTFYYESSDNFDEYLSELGVGYFLRKLAALAFPIITVSRSAE